ncbi:xylulokinase [Planctomycetota bacterium]
MTALFMGLDSSTQSLSATIIDGETGTIIQETGVNYDEHFGEMYDIANGVLRMPGEGEIHQPPLMWLDALDLLLAQLKQADIPLDQIRMIGGSGQQHGSVYLGSSFADALTNMEGGRSLSENLKGVFTRPTAPIWMDSSTGEECGEIETAVGGKEELIRLTGSAAFRRFTGPQIRKFHKQDPTAYADTALIQLVSSFMASVLTGKPVPIDPGDGGGMNLMDISTCQWSPAALDAAAPELCSKLLPIQPSDTVGGKISSYFVEKYGFGIDTDILLFSGDNPCSLIGVGLVEPGMAAVSLGTSDTFFACMPSPNTSLKGEGVVFGAPNGLYMSLVCMRNGSLAREKIRDAHGLDWDGFGECLAQTQPGNGGALMLPYFEQEIYPPLSGVRRFDLAEDDAAANVRAVIEAQAMAMRVHSEWMGIDTSSICMTGGASVNPHIRQAFADIFRAQVYQFETPNSASLGAALRALYRHGRLHGPDRSWIEAVKPFTRPQAGSTINPDPSTEDLYADHRERFIECEEEALRS